MAGEGGQLVLGLALGLGQCGRGSRLALADCRWWGGSLEMPAVDRRVLREPATHLESL